METPVLDNPTFKAAVASRKAGHNIIVGWTDSADNIPTDLWKKCFGAQAEGLWWYRCLENAHLEDQFKFLYGVIYDTTNGGAQPIGIVPAFLMDVPMELVAPEFFMNFLKMVAPFVPGALYQRTLFVGSPCADEGTIGLLSGYSLRQIVPYLQKELELKGRQLKVAIVAYKDFGGQQAKALDSLTEAKSTFAPGSLFTTVSYPGTRVSLPPGGFESYLASLKSSRRHNLRKKLKRSKEKIALSYEVIQFPNEEVLEETFALFWQTYEHGKTKFERLTKTFFRSIAKEPTSYYVLLRRQDNNRLVAFMLCFKFGDKIINKFIGLDYEQAEEWHLYFRLWEAAVTWAQSISAREIQSGQTGYRAKTDLGHDLVPLTNYCKHLNPLIHCLYAHLAKDITMSSLDEDLATFLKAHPEG
jgi:hypothetical protein